MHIIKVDAIDSTNSYARELLRRKPTDQPFCISAAQQLNGRGQRGTTWDSQPGQNLTFSMLYPQPSVSPGSQFLISAVVATAIVRVLSKFNIPNLSLKWPNDIMSAKHKVGGILIENIVSENRLSASIIGVGLNVNQTEFKNLPSAASLKLVSGVHFCLEELLQKLLLDLEKGMDSLSRLSEKEIMERYKTHLFRKEVPSTFQLPDKSFFTGIIEDVTPAGKLVVRKEEDALVEFDLKEVKLCF